MTTFPDVDADDTVCVLSNGNPIVDLNDNQSWKLYPRVFSLCDLVQELLLPCALRTQLFSVELRDLCLNEEVEYCLKYN